MVFNFRRSSSLMAPILPVTAPPEEIAPQAAPSPQPTAERPAVAAAGKTPRKLSRLDTSAREKRQDSFGLVTSPLSNDGTLYGTEDFEGAVITEEKSQKDYEKTAPSRSVTEDIHESEEDEEEQPGDGNVWDIWQVLPKETRRYNKPADLIVTTVKVPPGSLYLTRPVESMPEGWTAHIHPEGKPYYHRRAMEPEPGLLKLTEEQAKAPMSRPLPIVTDSDPRDPKTRKKLEDAHRVVRRTLEENNVVLPQSVDLFLELYPKEEGDWYKVGGYYLADHDNNIIFWAAEIDTGSLNMEKINPDTASDQHLKLQLCRQYWTHVECFPVDGCIDIALHQEKLIEQLTFLYIDISTSHTSTSIWTASQCQNFLSVLGHSPKGRKTWIIGRLMSMMMYWQFLNFYGHPSARLDRLHAYQIEKPAIEQDVGETWVEEAARQESWKSNFRRRCVAIYRLTSALLLRICVLLLFDAPTSHNHALNNVFVDKIVYTMRFQTMMEGVLKDWGETSLLATVLWTANMAFLAIPYLGNGTPSHYQGILQEAMIAASLASTVFAVGSIAVGLIHMKKHRLILTSDDAHQFLSEAHHPIFRLQLLAVLWSLPFAFLLWSVLTFSVAVLVFCATVGSNAPKYVLIPLSIVMLGWVLVTVWYLWKRGTDWTVDIEKGETRERVSFSDLLRRLRLRLFGSH